MTPSRTSGCLWEPRDGAMQEDGLHGVDGFDVWKGDERAEDSFFQDYEAARDMADRLNDEDDLLRQAEIAPSAGCYDAAWRVEVWAAIAPSVAVLREQGPLTLRDLTAATAKRMGCPLLYADVDAVMSREQETGRVRLVSFNVNDYRDSIWAARDA